MILLSLFEALAIADFDVGLSSFPQAIAPAQYNKSRTKR